MLSYTQNKDLNECNLKVKENLILVRRESDNALNVQKLKGSQIWKPSAGLRNTFSTNGVNSSDALGLFVLKTVSDIWLLDADKSVKFISNALEVLAIESALMVTLSFFTDVSLIKDQEGVWVVRQIALEFSAGSHHNRGLPLRSFACIFVFYLTQTSS